jgi:hypothetical protein
MKPEELAATKDLMLAAIAIQKAAIAVQNAAVTRARVHGATWQQIADILGVTKQSAHRRFRTEPGGA